MTTITQRSMYAIFDPLFYIREDSEDSYERPAPDSARGEMIERHFNDLFKLFIRKLLYVDNAIAITEEDKKILHQLLDELLHMKSLL